MADDPTVTTVTVEQPEELGQTHILLTHVGFTDRTDLEQDDAGWCHRLDRLEDLHASQVDLLVVGRAPRRPLISDRPQSA